MSVDNLRRDILVVALDELVPTTTLAVEHAFALLRNRPLRAAQLGGWALRGVAHLRRRLDESSETDASVLPYRAEMLEWLRQRKKSGDALVLSTGDMPVAGASIASHLGIFDAVANQSPTMDLGPLRELHDGVVHMIGGDFDSSSAPAVPGNMGLARDPRSSVNDHTGGAAPPRLRSRNRTSFRTVMQALRIHQWAKNLLLFVPLFASHQFWAATALRDTLIAFLVMSACASGVYLLNDLLDLSDDRRHPSKRFRPLASGTLPAIVALALIPVLLLASFSTAAWLLPRGFLVALALYYGLTLAYSLTLKRIVIVDVMALAMLYTIRVIAGSIASAQAATFWLLAFCMFIFLSLAFLKRYAELRQLLHLDDPGLRYGRGYGTADYELLASLGTSAGYLSVLVLALYINDASSMVRYRSPQWMWPACLLLLYWVTRTWLFAHRGQMHDDPVIFALRDNVSRCVGVLFLAVFFVAAL